MNDLLLEMQGIDKHFGGVHALSDVDLSVSRGEVLGLVGENGAGKSTLMKVLAGAVMPDAGRIFLEGKEVDIPNPSRARDLGIKVIYQEFTLVPERSVAENIFLGQLPSGPVPGFVDFNALHTETARLLESLNINVEPQQKVGRLGIAEQQLVEIAKAFFTPPKILVMDEPTAALSSTETVRLFELMAKWKERGVSIIFISHRLEEVFAVADRISVLRDGVMVDTVDAATTDIGAIIRMMVGRTLESMFPKIPADIGEVVLSVQDLTVPGRCEDISLELRRGEILGLAGLMGSGRTDLVQALFGAIPKRTGKVRIGGEVVDITSPEEAIRSGMAYVPENRIEQGLVLPMSVGKNMVLSAIARRKRSAWMNYAWVRTIVEGLVDALQIVTFNPFIQLVSQLSGGNQQKVVIGRGLAVEPTVLLVDEPTRGVDVAAKAEIHRLLGEYVQRGNSVIMVSSELPEVLGTSDRIAVMRKGRIVAILDREDATEERIMQYAVAGVQL